MTHYGEKLSAQLGLQLTKDLVKEKSLNESSRVINRFKAKVIAEGTVSNMLDSVSKNVSGDSDFQYRSAPGKVLTSAQEKRGINPSRKGNVLSPYEDPDSALNQQQSNLARQVNRNFAKNNSNAPAKVYEELEFIALSNKSADILINEESIQVTPLMARNIIKLHEAVNPKNKKILKDKLCESSQSFYECLSFAVKKV